MELKFKDLVKFNLSSQNLSNEKMPLSCAYKLSKIKSIVSSELDFYQEKYFEIINEYGEKDEQGKLKYSEDGAIVQIQPDKIGEAQNKINELDNMIVTLNIEDYLLEITDFDKDKKISMEDINGLLPFMK